MAFLPNPVVVAHEDLSLRAWVDDVEFGLIGHNAPRRVRGPGNVGCYRPEFEAA